MLEEICLYQFTKTEKIPVNSKGDCYKCKPDKYNKRCKGYYPIKVIYYEHTTIKKERD